MINQAKIQLRQRGRELLFSDWQAANEPDDALADRFTHNGSWQSPPMQWDMEPGDASPLPPL